MTSLQITKLVFSPSIFYPWQCYTNLMTFCFSLNLLRNLLLHFISWIMYHSVPTLHVLHHLLNLSINLPEPTPSTTLISIVFPAPIDLSLSFYSIKRTLKQFFWDHFVNNFNSSNYCSFHYLCPCYKCVDTRSVTFK